MVESTIDTERRTLSGPLLLKLARVVGAGSEPTKEAFDAALPTMLYVIADRGATENGARMLLNGMATGLLPAVELSDLSRAFADPAWQQRLLTGGDVLVCELLDPRTGEVVDALHTYGGLGRTGALKMMSVAATVALGLVARAARAANLDAPGLATYLADQRPTLATEVPMGMRPILGLRSVEIPPPRRERDLPREQPDYDEEANFGAVMTVGEAPSRKRFYPYVLVMAMLLLAIGIIASLVTPPSRVRTAASRPPAPRAREPQAGPVVDGVTFRSDSRAVREIEIAINRNVDRPWRLSLDGITFAPRSARLPKDAEPVLRDLAAVLHEHPDARIALEGHGDMAALRAEAAKARLTREGVAPDRILTGTAERPALTNSGIAGSGDLDVILLSR